MAPKVTVVLPTYNQAGYLPEALNGIFAQTYPDYELIVVNDGSTDMTRDILAEFRHEHPMTVVSQDNLGLPRALNAGFARAQGEYLTWISSDNVMRPHMLELLVRSLDEDPSLGLVYADLYLINEHGHKLGRFGSADYDRLLILHVNLVLSAFLYRRECSEQIGGYDPEFAYAEDWEYWIRLSQVCRMKHIAEPLNCHRLHSASMTNKLLSGDYRGISYGEFAARVRQQMPLQWWIGKLKWWWLRLSQQSHPAIESRSRWQGYVTREADIQGSPHAS